MYTHMYIYIYIYTHICLAKTHRNIPLSVWLWCLFPSSALAPPHHFQHVFFMRCGCACYANYCGKLLWHIPFAKEQNHYPLWHVPFCQGTKPSSIVTCPFCQGTKPPSKQNCQLVWSIVVITPFCQGCFLHFFAITTFCQGK